MTIRQSKHSIRFLIAITTLSAAALLMAASAHAAAPIPEVVDSLVAHGQWESYVRMQAEARAQGYDAPVERNIRLHPQWAAGATSYDYRIPCILVDFSDNPASGGRIASTPAMFDSLLFSTSPKNPTGSFKDYYNEISYGQMNVIGTVVGWFRMPQTYAYYVNAKMGMGLPPQNAGRLVEAAIDSASHYLDFSQFDNNHDGWVDGVMVVFPGPGYEETGDTNQIQSHRYHTTIIKNYNGVNISDYTIQPEETARTGGDLNSIGVFCHEWGHILGLVDLYDLDTDPKTTSWGLGAWSLMATGNYNGPPGERAKSPAHPDAWSRIKLGFVPPDSIIVPNMNLVNVPIPQMEMTPKIYKLWTGGVIPLSSQYFLVENRQKTGFDTWLPGKGLLIYHVDPAMPNNRSQWIESQTPWGAPHYMVALEQADGFFNLEFNTSNQGDGADPFFADSAGFDGLSFPSSRAYNGAATQVAVWNISAPGATMTANLDVVYSRPFLRTQYYILSDPAGNGNGIADPGETFQIVFNLASVWQATSNVDVKVSAPGSGLTFVDSVFHVDNIGSNVTINNATHPIRATVPAVYRSRNITFKFDVTAAGGASHWSYSTQFDIGPPHELIVDDDRGGVREVKYKTALTGLGEVYRVWNVDSLRMSPPADTLKKYPIVIWLTGDSNSISPTHASVLAMKSYLDNNGHLFLTGQDIAENLTLGPDSSFFKDYFGVRWNSNEQQPVVATGVSGDPISNGLMVNGSAADGSINQKSPDILLRTPGSPAVVCYTYMFDNDSIAAIHIERNGYRAVFFAFGFEAITSQQSQGQTPFATRIQTLTPILKWLDGEIPTDVKDEPGGGIAGAGVPDRFELSQNYPNPFNAGTVIPFTLTGNRTRQVRLEVIDILGRQVRVLLDEPMPAGRGLVNWDGTDKHGTPVASGVYFYRLSVEGEGTSAKPMVLIK